MNQDDVEHLVDCYPTANILTEITRDSYSRLTIGECKDVLPYIELSNIIDWEGDSDHIVLLLKENKL